MNSEELFFKYAFPCSNVLAEMGAISHTRFEMLKKNFENNITPSRVIMEDSFKAAFRRLKALAKEMNIIDYWDKKVIEEYWQNGNHNKNIDEGEGNYSKFPDAFNDFCKVHEAKVIDKKEDMLIVNYDKIIRPVFSILTPNTKIGDIVRIHHAYSIEKI